MAQKEVKTFKVTQPLEETLVSSKPAVIYNNNAYSLYEADGKWHVIEIPFNQDSKETGEIRIIESNTDKFIIQERLHVILLSNGLDVL
jgi:hypothetical protein